MQIVINISKDDFEEICMQARMVEDTGSLFGRIRKAISHSTPLPKGHGAIKDISQIEIPMCEDRAYERWVQVAIDAAPTIIEAERSEK